MAVEAAELLLQQTSQVQSILAEWIQKLKAQINGTQSYSVSFGGFSWLGSEI